MKFPIIFLSILCFSPLLLSSILAVKNSYIVYLGSSPHGLGTTSTDLSSITNSHYELLESQLGSAEKGRDALLYSYSRVINGFAAVLNEEQAAEIAKHPDVLSVFPNKGRKLHTTRSWDFLGLERDEVIPKDSIWRKANFGEDIIIANLDTGVWPESRSFSDEGLGPVPKKWRGICQKGINDKVHCNRKLIGVRYFNKGFAAHVGKPLNSSYQTARDIEGHGSHTLSTAGGNFVAGANFLRFANGTAKGGSPRARVASYKVCWPPIIDDIPCLDADVLAGFDAAIADGVDVLSVSLGGPPKEFSKDVMAIGSFHATQKGIVVVSSAGNNGPSPGSVTNVAPWIITVGASTLDREFTSVVALGNRKHLKGASRSRVALPIQQFYPLIHGADAKADGADPEDAMLCKPGTLDPKKVTGKILACVRGETERLDKGKQASLAGAVGFILVNDASSGDKLNADLHVLPTSHITFTDGVVLFNYINTTKTPGAYLTRAKTELGVKPAPVIATFSARGPNEIEKGILKPDITAPGKDIIAAFTQTNGGHPYSLLSGTSMACPHVAGIVGLLKNLHPHWSPAAIRSAIMTTASTQDYKGQEFKNKTHLNASPFDYGAGQVSANAAMDPGLVYDLTIDDYSNFLCAHGYNEGQIKSIIRKTYKCPESVSVQDFNNPSITIPSLRGTTTVIRKLKNVGSPGTYTVKVWPPTGVDVSVTPKILKFSQIGEEQVFKVTFKSKVNSQHADYVFGQLIWSDDKHHYVKTILVVKSL